MRVLHAPVLHVVVPAGIDDPERPSGGNIYDRRVIDGLRELGWEVHEHEVAGAWPQPGQAALASLGTVLAGLSPDAVVLIDGLIACCSPSVVVPAAGRLRPVVLVHMPLGPMNARASDAEHQTLAAAAAVITTSEWTRDLLVSSYSLHPDSVCVARPGVDEAPLAPGSSSGRELLCVAAVTPHKGHLDLAAALALVADLPWTCVLVGSLAVDPRQVSRLRDSLRQNGLLDRVQFVGPLTGGALEQAYAAADLLVLPSHSETYGMVVAEALARGIPVLATQVGGVPEALGAGPLPGLLVPAHQPAQLADALRSWLGDADLRARLRHRAAARRRTLTTWPETTAIVARALDDTWRT